MSSVAREKHRQTITTPTPRIKIAVTAWTGTSREKHWSLLKPVTVIGSRKHAQIQAREEQVSRSHAAIVNNGTSVLLVDLLSETGTYHNGKLVSRTLLRDGDVIRAGSLELKVSIELPANPAVAHRGMVTFDNPFMMPQPMRLVEVNTEQCWELDKSVSIIGSCRDAQIVVAGEDIARAHSMIFATIHGVGIVDLGSSMPLKINGSEKKMVFLKQQDRLLIGRAGLMVQFHEGGQSMKRTAAGASSVAEQNPNPGVIARRDNEHLASEVGQGGIPGGDGGDAGIGGDAPAASWSPGEAGVDAGMASLESKISDLQQDLAQSWGQINDWKKKLTGEHNNLVVWGQDLQNKKKELGLVAAELDRTRSEAESQDAKLKELSQELESRACEIGKSRREAAQAKSSLDAQDTALKKRYAELTSLASELDQRREEVERFSQEYEAQRDELESKHKELEARETQLRSERTEIDQQRQSIEALSREIDQRTESMDGRETKLGSRESLLAEQQTTIEQERLELEALREELRRKEEGLTDFANKLSARREKLIGQARSLRERSKIIDRFGQFLTEANEAFDITVHSPVEASPEDSDDVGGLEHPPEASLAEASRAISRAGSGIHETVASLQDETKQMIDELPAETSTEEGGDVASAPQQEADGSDLAKLEPEVREHFRARKRLGGHGKTDAELVEQIRKDLKSKSQNPPKEHKKKAWWKG